MANQKVCHQHPHINLRTHSQRRQMNKKSVHSTTICEGNANYNNNNWVNSSVQYIRRMGTRCYDESREVQSASRKMSHGVIESLLSNSTQRYGKCLRDI